MFDPAEYSSDEVLLDGRAVRLRAIRADDKQRLNDGFHRLTSQSVHYRFFTTMRELSDDLLVRFTEPDFRSHVALVAVEPVDDDECIVGVGRYICSDPKTAEVALAVVDDHQGLGLGTLLLRHLVSVAREKGVERFEADVLSDNGKMLEVFEHSGFPLTRSLDSGVEHLSFEISGAST